MSAHRASRARAEADSLLKYRIRTHVVCTFATDAPTASRVYFFFNLQLG